MNEIFYTRVYRYIYVCVNCVNIYFTVYYCAYSVNKELECNFRARVKVRVTVRAIQRPLTLASDGEW